MIAFIMGMRMCTYHSLIGSLFLFPPALLPCFHIPSSHFLFPLSSFPPSCLFSPSRLKKIFLLPNIYPALGSFSMPWIFTQVKALFKLVCLIHFFRIVVSRMHPSTWKCCNLSFFMAEKHPHCVEYTFCLRGKLFSGLSCHKLCLFQTQTCTCNCDDFSSSGRHREELKLSQMEPLVWIFEASPYCFLSGYISLRCPQPWRGFLCLQSHLRLLSVSFLMVAPLSGMRWNLNIVLVLISQMASETERFFFSCIC